MGLGGEGGRGGFEVDGVGLGTYSAAAAGAMTAVRRPVLGRWQGHFSGDCCEEGVGCHGWLDPTWF